MSNQNECIQIISGYADDLLTLGHGIEALEKELEKIKEWNIINCMTINKDKSGIMFLELGNKNNIDPQYKKLYLDNFPIIFKYKYLGVIIDNNFNLNYNT